MKVCGKCKIKKESDKFYNCSATKDGKHWICMECSNFQSKISTRKRYKIREQILEHYGNGVPHCNCCGEFEVKFLVIDHVLGNGNEERKKKITGYNLWKKIIKESYPNSYQVLCYNCNMAKAFHGMCPHKIEQLKNKIVYEKDFF